MTRASKWSAGDMRGVTAEAKTEAARLAVIRSPRRRIRLSRILIDLRRQARVVEAEAPTGRGHPRPARVRTNITVGEILDRSAHAGFGFMFALLAVASLPLPGISVPFGVAIVVGAAQMIMGGSRPWLPRIIRKHAISMRTLTWISVHLSRWTRGMERWVRPRFEMMTRGPFWSLCGLGILILGVGLSLPLPIPFSNMIFIIPLLVYSIGLLENDGILIALGHALVAVILAGAVLYGQLVVEAVSRGWSLLTGWLG